MKQYEITVKAFMEDNCTEDEAKRFIEKGGEAIKSTDWNQYVSDNDLRDSDGELITMENAKEELDARFVTVDGEQYILLYVL